MKIARVLLAVGVLALLIRGVGARAIATSLGALELTAVAAIMALLITDSLLRAWNWRALLMAREGTVPPAALSRRTVWYSYLVGGFFGSVVPSSLGPDVARITMLARRGAVRFGESGASLVLLNVIALWTLTLMTAAGSAVWLLRGGPAFLAPLLAACTGAAALLPVLGLAGPRLRHRVFPHLPRPLRAGVEAMVALSARRDVLLRAAAVTVLNHVITVTSVALVAYSIASPVGILHLLVLVPMVTMFRLVPLSVSGFGAEQGAFVFLLGFAGISSADALTTSLVLSGTSVLFNASCGLLYLFQSGVSAGAAPRTASDDAVIRRKPAAAAR